MNSGRPQGPKSLMELNSIEIRFNRSGCSKRGKRPL